MHRPGIIFVPAGLRMVVVVPSWARPLAAADAVRSRVYVGRGGHRCVRALASLLASKMRERRCARLQSEAMPSSFSKFRLVMIANAVASGDGDARCYLRFISWKMAAVACGVEGLILSM